MTAPAPGPAAIRILLFFAATTAALERPQSQADSRAAAKIEITNISDGAELRHPVAFFEGRAPGKTALKITNTTRPGGDGTTEACMADGRFKGVVLLAPGENKIIITDPDAGPNLQKSAARITIRYKAPTTAKKVQVVYLTGSEGETKYLTQKSDDPQNYKEKLATSVRLLQTFAAETLQRAGQGRHTFSPAEDAAGNIIIHTIAHPLPAAELRKKTGDELFQLFYPWIQERFPMNDNKIIVIMAFTGYDAEKKKPLGHTALGGGGMGLFSSNALCSWPSNLRDVTRAFSDTTPVDDTKIWDDSAFRGTLWGLCATTLGATMHEMGHSFTLPHSPDPESIMSRGFDHLNRFFTIHEPPAKGARDIIKFNENQVARFESWSAVRLRYCGWFDPDPVVAAGAPPAIHQRAENDDLIVKCEAGIAAVQFHTEEASEQDLFSDKPVKEHKYSRSGIRKRFGKSREVEIAVFDRFGRAVSLTLK